MKILLLVLICINIYAYERIITLSPSLSELVFTLECGDKLIANTKFSNYPKAAQKKPKVGGYFEPNIEKILALKPDVIFLQSISKKLSTKLQNLGLQTKMFKIKTLEDIKKTILELGILLKKTPKAKQIVRLLDEGVKSTQGIIKDKKILMVIGHPLKLNKRIFVVGNNLYLNDIIKLSGNKNAYSSDFLGQPILNLENIIALNPDIVIILAPYLVKKHLTKSQLKLPWKNLPITASKKEAIYVLGKEYAGISSDRIQYFLKDFQGFLQDVRAK